MNYNYYFDGLKKAKETNRRFKGDPIYDILIDAYQRANIESTMRGLVGGSLSIQEYVDGIMGYDRLIVEYYTKKPQKSNPVNTGQNKLYPNWREQKWAPFFEWARLELQGRTKLELKLVQNNSVVQVVYEDGTTKHKKVDNGIVIEAGFNGQKLWAPVVMVEDKGGHACSTCFDGVAGVAGNFKKSFPHSLLTFITDNNVSMAADTPSAVFQDIDVVICERGDNRVGLKDGTYQPLRSERWQSLYDAIMRYFTPEMLSRLAKVEVVPVRKSGKFREQIDRTGTFIAF